MVFSDTLTKQGLIQDCEQKLFGDDGYGQISGNTNRLYRFTQLLNEGVNKATSIILASDMRWQYDDPNYTDYPVGTASIVLGQRNYELSVSHLKVLKVQFKDQNGIWRELPPFDEDDQGARPYLENNASNNTGIPVRYDKFGSQIWLDPIPNFNSTSGLRIYYQRPPSLFTYQDATKVPGFPSIFHVYVSTFASLEYAKDRGMVEKVRIPGRGGGMGLSEDLANIETRMTEFYSKREKDDPPKITPHRESSR